MGFWATFGTGDYHNFNAPLAKKEQHPTPMKFSASEVDNIENVIRNIEGAPRERH